MVLIKSVISANSKYVLLRITLRQDAGIKYCQLSNLFEVGSLAGEFEVETTKRYTVGLEYAEGERAVHVEQVLADAAELHVYLIIVVLVYQLEVLDAGLVDTPVEIEHEGLHLFVPLRRFVEKEHDVFRVIIIEFALDRVRVLLRVRPEKFLPVAIYHWQQHFHSSWAL